MTKMTGKAAIAIIAGTTITASDVTNITFTWTADTVENQGMGDDFKSRFRTLKDFAFTINGYYEATGAAAANSLRAALKAAWDDSDGIIAFDLRPAGSTGGLQKITGSAIMTSQPVEIPYADMVLTNAQFVGTGTVTEGTV